MAQESIGSFYVLKSQTYKTGWRLMRESYVNQKRKQATVKKTAWAALGFTDSMTLEQARARAQQLNAQNSTLREQARSIAAIAHRVERDRLNHSAFVPEDLNEAFIKHIRDNITGSARHMEKVLMSWASAKKMIIKLQLTPEFYASNKKQFYRYLSSKEYSLDYTNKILRMLNMYGLFCGRITGKYYEPVAPPKGHDREMINDAYLDKDGYYGPSEPLQPASLAILKDKLNPAQHAWLTVSVWFGLRPSEIDMVMGDRNQKTWRVEPGETDVLWVYQPKLTSKPRARRWKPIPVLYPEQQEALKVIYKGGAAKPLTKTLKRHLGNHTTLYGGRKGFTDLMLDRGQRLEDIAQWLGHSSIEMTWTRYKDKKRVGFTKVK